MPIVQGKEFSYSKEGIAAARKAMQGKGLGKKRIMTSDGFMPRRNKGQMTKPAVIPAVKSGQELIAGVKNLQTYNGGATSGLGKKIVDSVGQKMSTMTGNLDKKLGTNTSSMASGVVAAAKRKML